MITKREKKMLLYTAGIASLVLVHFVIVSPGREERAALRSEGERLAAELESARNQKEMQEYYIQETDAMQEEMDAVLGQYPAEITEEMTIMYADMLEEETDTYIPNISIGNSNYIYTLGQESGMTAENGISLYGTPVVYTFTCSYDDMKKIVRTIQEDEERRNVEELTLSYESGTGMLVGNMTVNMYALAGAGREYEPFVVPSMPLGTDNIFGTLTSQVGGDADESEEADEEETETETE